MNLLIEVTVVKFSMSGYAQTLILSSKCTVVTLERNNSVLDLLISWPWH